jgi:hypothetical protein
VKTGEGYIYGFVNAGKVKAYRLWCESCMDEKLAKSLDTAFDESDKQNALEYAKSAR